MRSGGRTCDSGFTLSEMVVVVAILAIITAIGVPVLLTYWQSATLTAGAQELASLLNRGRQLAISENTPVCVTFNEVDPGTGQPSARVRFRVNGCPGVVGSVVWTGSGTDVNGFVPLANNVAVAAGANVVFNQLGAATTPGTYTVRNPADGRTMTVTVASSGRVTVGS
jgi:prepilin-type N-terminal cleavage/methylation domain-containing protein